MSREHFDRYSKSAMLKERDGHLSPPEVPDRILEECRAEEAERARLRQSYEMAERK